MERGENEGLERGRQGGKEELGGGGKGGKTRRGGRDQRSISNILVM